MRLSIVVALAAVLAGCTGPSGPVVFLDETTADGLQRVRSSRVDRVWLMPGASLEAYSRVAVLPVTIAYKRPPEGRGRAGNFALTSGQMQLLERSFQQAFEREIGRSESFELATEPGPDVLAARGRIVDLVVEVSPSRPGRGGKFVRRAGAMTLILDVADSVTGAPLARLADRSEVTPASGFEFFESNSVNVTAAFRQTMARWARILRDGLDILRSMPAIPQAPLQAGEPEPAPE